MGASSSTDQVSEQVKEAESIAASTGSLPLLQNAFSKLSDPKTNSSITLNSLQECLCLNTTNPVTEPSPIYEHFLKLLAHIGPSIVDLFFTADQGGVCWVEFLRGYDKCCGRMPSSACLNNLFRLYSVTSIKAGFSSKLEFESDADDSKISGYLLPSDVAMLLWMCWIMFQSSRVLRSSKGKATVFLPDINHLILSAITSCTENSEGLNIKDCDISTLKDHISVQKLHMWALTTVPDLAYCFTQYVRYRLQICATAEDDLDSTIEPVGDASSSHECEAYLLTCGRAWGICLSQKNTFSEELLRVCIPGKSIGTYENLLYRSSEHGKGLNRFWSSVEGYLGQLLLLISATSENASGGRWVIGVLTQQGFENRDSFYGSSGYLYAISPSFHIYSPSGKDKNFVYSHSHPTGKVYEAHPKLVGIGFGGMIGNERIFMDEDFARVTIRHHAVDKTYKPGSLIPNQGFLPVEASILGVEVWGLGGKTTKEKQDTFKKRESLFSEQRRKVDLKNFAWEDSPEKVMMDMVSDPNRVQREDR
ncbi:hypothetical protein AAC387_Pa01g1004 [Persea americana]